MKAQEKTIGHTLLPPQVLKVPIYQRTYSWSQERQLNTFWSQLKEKADAVRAGNDEVLSHYFGALLLVPSDGMHGELQTYNIVDGQQRLTTVMLCLSAFRQLAELNGYDRPMLEIGSWLFNEGQVGNSLKLETNAKDRGVFSDLMRLGRQGLREKYHHLFHRNGSLNNTKVKENKPFAAYWYFLEEAEKYIFDGSMDDQLLIEERHRALVVALKNHFKFIVIELENTDDAQVIFETLNTGGEPLAAMDLVRNSIFQRASREGPDVADEVEDCLNEFHEKFWDREIKQGRLKRRAVDHYLTHALTAQTGREISISELYADYKRYQRYQEFESAKQEAETLVHYTSVYRQLVEASGARELSQLGRLFDKFDVGTAMPIVFVVATADVDDQEKKAIYDILKSFIVRRAVCELTTEGRNLLFAELARNLRKNEVTTSYFCEELVRRTGPSRYFPDDEEFKENFLNRQLYKSLRSKRVAYILYQIEAALRDRYDEVETDLAPRMTVEHILPQDWITHWLLKDGRKVPEDGLPIDPEMAEDMRLRSEAVQKIGNLTLLTGAGNSKNSNLPFETKKSRLFNSSLLRLNREIALETEWDEERIDARAKKLFEIAVAIWPSVHIRAPEFQ